MGLIKEDQDLESINKHAQNILNILKFSGLYSATIKKLIDKIIKFGETNIIDFDLIEKNLKNVMKGRRVYLDFRDNCKDFDLKELSPEAHEYLEKSGALFGTPIDA